jgi:glycosidase
VDIAFEFDLAGAILNAVKNEDNQELLAVQERILESYGQGQYAAFLTNHDQNRVINQLQKNRERARVAATLLLTNPGVPFIYYGEEIGMRGVKPDEDIRRPMQWDASPGAGFTSGAPWRALNNDIATVNVQAETADPGSLFNHYRRLIHLRMDYPALRVGDLWLVDSSSDQVYAFLRYYESEAVLVLVNLGKEPVSDYALSLDKGPLQAGYTVQMLLGEGQASAPVVNASGGFEPYQPLPELAPYESVLIWLGP